MAEPMEYPVQLLADVGAVADWLQARGQPTKAKAVLQLLALFDIHRKALEATTILVQAQAQERSVRASKWIKATGVTPQQEQKP